MPITTSNLYIDQGIDFSTTIELENSDGIYDVTGKTFYGIASKLYSVTPAFYIAATIVPGGVLNDIKLVVAGASTATIVPGKYQYNIIMTDGLLKEKILEGLIFVLPTVTGYVGSGSLDPILPGSNGFTGSQGDIGQTGFTGSKGADGTSFVDASSDGKYYGRKNANWIEIDSPTLTITTYVANQSATIEDKNAYVRMNVASANTYTIPLNSIVSFPIGTSITVRQVGLGQTTIAAEVGVTILTPDTFKLRKNGSSVVLVKIGIDTWELSGDVEL